MAGSAEDAVKFIEAATVAVAACISIAVNMVTALAENVSTLGPVAEHSPENSSSGGLDNLCKEAAKCVDEVDPNLDCDSSREHRAGGSH